MTIKTHDIELQGSVWMTVAGENLGGPGRIALLAKIAACGSITQAAKSIGMSYKAAWDAIDTMNNMAGEPLVERLSGGKGGGGTRLTKRGSQLVENFGLIEQEHRRFVTHLNQQAKGIADDFVLLKRMTMKTSARNQFLGRVTHIKPGAVNDEIELTIQGGQRIVATITSESTENLGLHVGTEAFALIKASSIIIVTDECGAQFSTRNRLQGIVTRLQIGKVNTEVVIDLPQGGNVAAIVSNDSSIALDLKIGAAATAIFHSSSVILGITTS